jgi:hypothetical protein
VCREEGVIYKADLEYVRQLLAKTEALLKDVEAAIAEARRLHEQLRRLHDKPRSPGTTTDDQRPPQA